MKSSWFLRPSRFFCPFVLFSITTVLAQTNPFPLLNQPLVPTATAPGGPSFTLTVNGTGFGSGSVVKWNGKTLTTTFVSNSQLTAAVPASDIATASTASITVSNPPPGGGNSNVVYFAVSAPTSLQFTSVALSSGTVCDVYVCGNFIAADFNRDRKLDLAFNQLVPTHWHDDYTSLGNGDGTFQTPVLVANATLFDFFVAADFNGDGKLDLVGVINPLTSAPYYAGILLGNGDGTFSNHGQINSEGPPPVSLADQVMAADFNGDGKLDAAISAADGLEVYLGNGDGTFQSVLPPNNFAYFFEKGVGDFNGDGKLDVVGVVGTQLEVFLGNGDGTFQTPTTAYTVGSSFGEGFAADLNGDNKLDLIIVQGPQPSTMTVLLGNGDGTFQPGTIYPISGFLASGAVADFNADGKLDVALSNSTNSVPSTAIMLGNGDGTFQNPVVFSTPANAGIVAGDFNDDGKLDLAVGTPNGLFLLLQDYVSDFSLAAASKTSVTVAPGQTANYTVNVVPGPGFAQTVSLTCSGAPAQSTCTVTPSSVTLDGINPAAVKVAVTTTASSMGITQPVNTPPIGGIFSACLAWSGILGLVVLATLRGRSRARSPQMVCGVILSCLFFVGLTMSACGGGNSGGGSGGTQAGTYTLTVTGTSGSAKLTNTTKLTLVVQ